MNHPQYRTHGHQGRLIRRAGTALMLAAAALLAGCATTCPGPDPSIVALNTQAVRIAHELTRLRRVDEARSPKVQAYGVPSGALALPIQFDWAGRLVPAVRAVTALLGHGWAVRVVGRAPVNPVVVTVHVTRTPAFDVLESLGWQGGRTAGVVINRAKHLIEVVYVSR